MSRGAGRASFDVNSGTGSGAYRCGVGNSGCNTDNQTAGGEFDAEFRDAFLPLIPALRSFARALSRDRELAEDLLQETLCKAWAARLSYRRGSNFKAWLFTILRNEACSYRRRSWREQQLNESTLEYVAYAPEDQSVALELSDAVRALKTLSVLQRDALLRSSTGASTYAEIAATNDCSLSAVRGRIRRARSTLAAILAGDRRSRRQCGPTVASTIQKASWPEQTRV